MEIFQQLQRQRLIRASSLVPFQFRPIIPLLKLLPFYLLLHFQTFHGVYQLDEVLRWNLQLTKVVYQDLHFNRWQNLEISFRFFSKQILS